MWDLLNNLIYTFDGMLYNHKKWLQRISKNLENSYNVMLSERRPTRSVFPLGYWVEIFFSSATVFP